MGENMAISPRTKHVDVRYHFVREFIQDGFIRIIFVKTRENAADIFTKNTSTEIQERHVRKMLTGKAAGPH